MKKIKCLFINSWIILSLFFSVKAFSALPAPWLSMDIGNVGITGSVDLTGEEFSILASGADIWGTADAFRFVYQPLSGDCEIIAKVLSVQNTNSWAKSGLMIRESLAANAKHAAVIARPNNGGVSFQNRSLTNGNCTNSSISGTVTPVWLKLVRYGSSFSAYYRYHESYAWQQIGTTITINMSQSVYVGLAVTSHNNSSLCNSRTRDVSVMSTGVAAINNLEAVSVNANSIKLKWTAEHADLIAKYEVLRDGISAGATIGKKGYFTCFNLSPLTSYRFKVRALNAQNIMLCESDELPVQTSDTTTVNNKMKILALKFNPYFQPYSAASGTPASLAGCSPDAITWYNEHFAGKYMSELDGSVVSDYANDVLDSEHFLRNGFAWAAGDLRATESTLFIKYLNNFFRTGTVGTYSFELYNDTVVQITGFPKAQNSLFQQNEKILLDMAYAPKSCHEYGCTNPGHVDNPATTEVDETPPFRVSYDVHNHDSIDYNYLVTTPRAELQGNSIVDLIESGEIDAVWLMGGPVLCGFKENGLIAKNYFGFDIAADPDCSRDFFVNVMGTGAQTYDAYAHRVEGMLNERSSGNPDNWQHLYPYTVYADPNNPNVTIDANLNLVDRFFLTHGRSYNMGPDSSATKCRTSAGNGNVGISHFPPTSLFNQGDYQYANMTTLNTYTPSCADDWYSFPDLPEPPQYRLLNKYDYGAFNIYPKGADAALTTSYDVEYQSYMYHQWWFNHIPHNPGVDNGKLNNWWPYILDINNFKGEAINYDVTGLPDIPDTYPSVNGEIGTDNSASLWGYWHSRNDQAGYGEIVENTQPADILQGSHSIHVSIDERNANNPGRNDLYFPLAKNADWDLRFCQALRFSIKFLDNADLVAAGGVNPVVRLYHNSGTRIEFVPVQQGAFANMFESAANGQWYDVVIPFASDPQWKKVVVGYVDPTLPPEAQAAARAALEQTVLQEVKWIEISIDAATTATRTAFSFIIDKMETVGSILSRIDIPASGAVLTSSPTGPWPVTNAVDGLEDTLMRSENANPAVITIAFPEPQTIRKVQVCLGQIGYPWVECDEWQLVAGDSVAELDQQLQTGGYNRVIVNWGPEVCGGWADVALSTPQTARVFRFTIHRKDTDVYVHIPEVQLFK